MICSLSLHQTAVLSGGAAYRMGLFVCMWLFLLFLITCQYLITGDILCKNRLDFSLNEKNKRSFNTGPVPSHDNLLELSSLPPAPFNPHHSLLF